MRKSARKRVGRPPIGVGAAAPLSREHVLKKALELIDHRGLGAFNMRDLAKALGVFPTAVYWHVPSRLELIAGVVELAMSTFVTVPIGEPWQARLRHVLYRFREVLHRHPGLAPVVATGLVSNITVDAQRMDQVILALEDAGFTGSGLVDAYNVVIAAMCGFATLELSSVPKEETESWEASCRSQIDAIDKYRWRGLARHAKALRNNAFMLRWSSGTEKPLEKSFDAWVDVVIRGLEERARAQESGATRRTRKVSR